MNQIGFEFPTDSSGQWDGYNDPGIETFAGSPFRSLGREITQNTLDAARDGVARLDIRLVKVQTESIPGLQELKEAVAYCAEGAPDEGPKAVAFFETAKSLLAQKELNVLQFSDSNTLGVKGPCVNGTPFFALMKATGQSRKSSDTARGSFGIGKFAPFTVSALRTVFLSTVFVDDDEAPQHYIQGKSILMSHMRGQTVHRGTGFWGVREGCLPLVGRTDQVPEWLRRAADSGADTGTTLSILGFLPSPGWQEILASSIAESFFGAIAAGKLEVTIDEGLTIDAHTLTSVFENTAIIESIGDQKDEPETFINSGFFYKALTDSERFQENCQNADLGHCRLHLFVAEGHPKKVAVLRDGMLITSHLKGLRRLGEFKEFSAVLECLTPEGNALLRGMEPPAHDDFEEDRLPSDELRRKGRRALQKLAHWVREMLKRNAMDPISEVTEINELAEFFGDPSASSGPSGETEENPYGRIVVRARRLPRRSQEGQPGNNSAIDDSESPHRTGSDGDQLGDGEGRGKGLGGSPEGRNEGEGGDDTSGGGSATIGSGRPSISIRNVRAVVISPTTRRIAFTPEISATISLELEDSGADSNRPLSIVSASIGDVRNGRLLVSTRAHTRVVIDVELEHHFEGTIRIGAHAV